MTAGGKLIVDALCEEKANIKMVCFGILLVLHGGVLGYAALFNIDVLIAY